MFPEFLITKPLRDVSDEKLKTTLADIDSHMPAHHIYRNDRDYVNWAHETTHGICARLRMKHSEFGNVQILYVLNNEMVVIPQPRITLAQVANRVPQSLRNDGYPLYMISQQRDWNNSPLYILEEMVAYSNGSLTAREYEYESRYKYSAYKALEMYTYSLTAAVVAVDDINYNITQLRGFLSWYKLRIDELNSRFKQTEQRVEQIYENLLKSPDCEQLRRFMSESDV